MAVKRTPLRSAAARLIAWHQRHGRHDLPWQGTTDAYRIWLSEIMLQQTQVTTVIPYYERFLRRFPTMAALAAAPLDDVLTLWSGLGYYSRARNLHRTACLVVERYGGTMPDDPQIVQTLPGIGRSTAAAICVFAYGGRHAILDGNVKRVLARYCGVRGYPGDGKVQAVLWDKAQALLPGAGTNARGIVSYTQGLMDLGASLCARSNPQCGDCPLRADCVAHARGLTATLPEARLRAALPQRATVMLVLRRGGEILLEKRAARGIWGGLWSLPEVAHASEAQARCEAAYGFSLASSRALPGIAHGFTHFKLDIDVLLLDVRPARRRSGAQTMELPVASAQPVKWLPLAEAVTAAIPTPVRKSY